MEIKVILKFNLTTNNITYTYNGTEKPISNWTEFEFGNVPIQMNELKTTKDATLEVEEVIKKGVKKLKIISILYRNQKYTRRVPQHGAINNIYYPHIPNTAFASAPYNFVPLNGIPIPSESTENDFSIYQENKLSGYIDLKITTKTHVYIKGEGVDFFKINGKEVIPGSSMRGLIRTMVEIFTFGKFTNFNNRKIFERKQGNNVTSGRQLGFLKFDEENDKFIIYEKFSKEIQIEPSTTENEFSYQIIEEDSSIYVKLYTGNNRTNPRNFKIEYKNSGIEHPVPIEIIQSYKDDDTREAKYDMADLANTTKYFRNAIMYKQLKSKNEQRKQAGLDEIEFIGFPVWYNVSNSKVANFGHCKNYRVPFQYSIGDDAHIPKALQDESVTDFAEQIFGKDKGLTAGKVYFEDAYCQNSNSESEEILQILASPKPTSYQLYLEQGNGRIKNWNDDAKIRGYKLYWHKNTDSTSDAELNWRKTRFRKLDVEKLPPDQSNDWIINKNGDNYPAQRLSEINNPEYKTNLIKGILENDKIQFTAIKALKKDVVFEKGRIRFDNLTKNELGALLIAINLPNDCYHKIGMGKPWGLGSIQIEPKLFYINRKERYKELIDLNGSWNLSINEETTQINSLIEDFKSFIISKLKSGKQEWDSRILELYTLLSLNETQMNTPNENELRMLSYMEGFGDKSLKLLKPSDLRVFKNPNS